MGHNIISGKNTIKILCKHFEFEIVGTRGSHVKLTKNEEGRDISTVVPLHDELKLGTLKGLLKLGNVDYKEFIEYL